LKKGKAKDYLIEHYDFDKVNEEERAKLLKPFIQTSALINESVNLEFRVSNGFIKVYEVGRNRKDRWSSLAYGNHFADILEKDLITYDEIDEDDDYVVAF
jgi:hypothetical protein